MSSGISISWIRGNTAKIATRFSVTTWTTLRDWLPNYSARPMHGAAKFMPSTTSITFRLIQTAAPISSLMMEMEEATRVIFTLTRVTEHTFIMMPSAVMEETAVRTAEAMGAMAAIAAGTAVTVAVEMGAEEEMEVAAAAEAAAVEAGVAVAVDLGNNLLQDTGTTVSRRTLLVNNPEIQPHTSGPYRQPAKLSIMRLDRLQ